MIDAGEIVKPSRERRRHNNVRRPPVQITDVRGAIGSPWQAETLLARLERQGDVTRVQRAAGELFHALFHRSALDPLKAADVSRVGGCGGIQHHHGSERAKHKIAEAMKHLGGHGSPQGSCAWIVLGCDYSIRQWAARMNWRGMAIREEVAKGILIATLAQLATFWGLTTVSENM